MTSLNNSITRSQRHGCCAIAASAVLFALPVAAQEGADSSGETIEEIQVTATRRATDVRDVSAAVNIISIDEVRNQKLVTDALAAEPGVFLQQTTPGQGAAIVRGLKGSEVLHLVDGMRMNNAIFRNAPTQYLSMVAPGTVERIEIVRGAPASLYGSDAVGGVVQVLSRRPSFGTPDVKSNAYLGFESADLAKIVNASVDAGNGSIAGILSGHYLATGNRRTGSGDRTGPSGYEASGARLALASNPDARQSWFADFQFARQPETPRYDELVPGFGQAEPSSAEFFFAPNERAFAHLAYALSDGPLQADWTIDAGWQRIVDDRISRNFASTVRRLEENRSDLYGLTISATAETTAGSWIAGAEIYHDRVTSRRREVDMLSGQSNDVTPRFPDGSTVDQAAVYGSVLKAVGSGHRLSGGLRFSSVRVQLPAAGSIAASSTNLDDFSADLGWVYDIGTKMQLTANLGYGFRAPNVFDLGTLGERPGNRFNIPNPSLQSERITHFDAGVRFRGERWDAELVVFNLHHSDRITSVLTGAVTPDGRDIIQSRNVASADIYGVEFAARGRLSDRLGVDLVANAIRGEQVEEDGQTAPGDRIPPVNGRIALTYDLSDDVTVEGYALTTNGQRRLSPRDIRDNRINPAGTPGWATLNLRALWQANDILHVSVAVENLADRRYRVHGSGIDAAGRNFIVGLQANW